MAHIAGYLHAAAGAAAAAAVPATAHNDAAAAQPPMFLCEGRATTARQASRRVSALAATLVQRLGMQVRHRRWVEERWWCCFGSLPGCHIQSHAL